MTPFGSLSQLRMLYNSPLEGGQGGVARNCKSANHLLPQLSFCKNLPSHWEERNARKCVASAGEVPYRMTIAGGANDTPLKGGVKNMLIGGIKSMFIAVSSLFLFAQPSSAQTLSPAEQFSNELGCPSCHLGLERKLDLRNKAPDLSHAGLRFNAAYLFDYLQNPAKVRQHLGRSRMPSFHFDQRESLALALYLMTLTQVEEQWSTLLPAARALVAKNQSRSSSRETKTLLTQKLNCTQCHKLGSEGHDDSIDLASVGYRLQPDWVKHYLVAPYIYDGVKTAMPSYFYFYESAQKKFEPMLAQPSEAIAEVTAYLFELGESKRTQLQRNYEQTRKGYPEITARQGEAIFLSQNCHACHRNTAVPAWFEKNAPDLSNEADRVQKDWLTSYLRNPTPLRPFGFYPGAGSRMPDFQLTNDEVAQLADYLFQQAPKLLGAAEKFQPQTLSLFAKNKARQLLTDKLACLGCHQLGASGGRIGPSFNQLNKRLRSDFVYRMIADPQRTTTETMMPKIMMPQRTRELLANFLLQEESVREPAGYLSLIDNPPSSFHDEDSGRQLYLKNCAACHGREGDGKGYNAKFLPKTPAAHSDSAYMSQRPDDTLYDGIHAGGYILNKSHTMPAWGQTLHHEEIQTLVRHMRKLCRCEGPTWAGDNR